MPSPRHNYHPNSGRAGSQSQEYLVDIAAKIGSRQLLAAQLRTGQHWLSSDGFWEKVRDLKAEGYL